MFATSPATTILLLLLLLPLLYYCTTAAAAITVLLPLLPLPQLLPLLLLEQDSVSSDADVLAAVNVASYPDGQEVNLEAVFGNSITFDDSGDVSAARATTQVGVRP